MIKKIIGKIVKVLDDYNYVSTINQDSMEDINVGHNYTIVGLADEIIDPDTGESLGQLEIVKGKVRAMHVQAKLLSLTSAEYSQKKEERSIVKITEKKQNAFMPIITRETETITPGDTILRPIKNVKLGDIVAII